MSEGAARGKLRRQGDTLAHQIGHDAPRFVIPELVACEFATASEKMDFH
jgi:hypothetical protein